ncbi:MAG: ATP-dependent zinc metalloprotease FtsH [Patescibacteria group bacterium]|jgi:cell division protease FtsH
MKKLIQNFLVFFVVFLVIATIFSTFSEGKSKTQTIDLGTLMTQVQDSQVAEIIVDGSKLKITLHDGTKELVIKEDNESLSALFSNYQIEPDKILAIKTSVKGTSSWEYFLINIVPFLFPFLIIGFFIFFMMRGVQGVNSRAMNFGQSGAKDFKVSEKNKTTFKDVAGAKEAKEELREVVEFLKFPKKFHSLGAKIPRGVLLLGAPGTGKTLLARSVAGEAKVPFLHISGSEFVEMFVGVGASRVRSLFEKAKKNSPCIIFIDEIDAVGRRRGAGLGGSHDEREQTLNQILVEMDGFEPTQNIIVIAATNRPDVLDPALLRPGRFDRRVMIDLPDLRDREAILKVHSRKKPLADKTNLKTIAERTAGFSGADLANVLNEAAILAAREDQQEISDLHLFEAIEKVLIGPERKSRIINDKEKNITAYHEAGHAIVSHFLPDADPVHKVSIIARGSAGGYTLKAPTEDRHLHSKSEFISEIAVLLAGHLVEKEIFGEVTTGASSDLRRATDLARRLVTDYGMSDKLGPRTFGDKEEMIFLGREIHEQRNYSEKQAELIDEEIKNFIAQGEDLAKNVIKEYRSELEKIVAVLLEKETIEKKEFEEIVGAKPKNI